MLPLFKIKHLKPADYRQAWPLVSMAHPGLNLRHWLSFARRASSGPRGNGLIAIEDERGVFHAIAIHRVAEDVEKGRMLRVQPVICARLPGRHLDDVLASELKALATELGCGGVMVETSLSDSAVTETARALIERGFVQSAISTFAPVPQERPKSH